MKMEIIAYTEGNRAEDWTNGSNESHALSLRADRIWVSWSSEAAVLSGGDLSKIPAAFQQVVKQEFLDKGLTVGEISSTLNKPEAAKEAVLAVKIALVTNVDRGSVVVRPKMKAGKMGHTGPHASLYIPPKVSSMVKDIMTIDDSGHAPAFAKAWEIVDNMTDWSEFLDTVRDLNESASLIREAEKQADTPTSVAPTVESQLSKALKVVQSAGGVEDLSDVARATLAEIHQATARWSKVDA